MFSVETQPDIFIGNLRIQEPVTTLTDVFVSILCFIAFFQLKKGKTPVQILFRYYFLMMGIASFSGGVLGHCFLYTYGMPLKIPGWVSSLFSIALLERMTIIHSKDNLSDNWLIFLKRLNIVLVIMLTISIFILFSFSLVTIYALFAIAVVATTLELRNFYRNKNKSSKFILLGILMAVFSAIVHSLKLAPHKWFNHLDLSHVFLFSSVLFFFNAAKENITEESVAELAS